MVLVYSYLFKAFPSGSYYNLFVIIRHVILII